MGQNTRDLKRPLLAVLLPRPTKSSASEAPDPGPHHVGTPGDIISECLGDFSGIRSLTGKVLFGHTRRLRPRGGTSTFVGESVTPSGRDPDTDDLDRSAARLIGFRLCRREADEDKAGQHVRREAVGKHERLGDAARPRIGEHLQRPAVRPT